MHPNENLLTIREYTPADCSEITVLFYQTVHSINAADYTKEQTDVWAPAVPDSDKWNQSLLAHYSLVATRGKTIVGFGDIDKNGYLDRLYVHKDCQRQGIATAICRRLEQITSQSRISVHASITAKPFFEKRGYHVVSRQQVERQGIFLTNYFMEKMIDCTVSRF